MNKKKIVIVLIVIIALIGVLNFTNVFGFNSFDVGKVNEKAAGMTEGMDVANNAVKRVWGTITLILQILAVAAIVIAGIRYMFASPDGKADIKKQTIFLIIGAILVFGASTVVNFIVNVTNEVTTGGKKVAVMYSGNIEGQNGRYIDYDHDNYNDWDDYLKVENGYLVSGNDGIPDIYQQDTNGNGICDYEDLWLPEHQ